jgi:hypothetical protein
MTKRERDNLLSKCRGMWRGAKLPGPVKQKPAEANVLEGVAEMVSNTNTRACRNADTGRTELEEARLQFSEGLLRLWEQADLVDKLLVEKRSAEEAKELLSEIRKTLGQMRLHIQFLVETSGRKY